MTAMFRCVNTHDHAKALFEEHKKRYAEVEASHYCSLYLECSDVERSCTILQGESGQEFILLLDEDLNSSCEF
jgi:hypothetical protein